MSASHERRRRRLLDRTTLTPPSAALSEPFQDPGRQLFLGMLKGLGDSIRFAMGAAMAAMTLDKPRGDITAAEADTALEAALAIPDPVWKARVLREGYRAAIRKMAPELLPAAHADKFIAALTMLDEGDPAPGILTPTPVDRVPSLVETKDGQ